MKPVFKKILPGILTIVAFGGIAVGTTYGLFTSDDEANIAITAGKVNVTATISDFKTYSGKYNETLATPDYEIVETDTAGVFTNGGTAELDDNVVTLTNMSPMDKVTFNINIKNNSNIDIKMRTLCDFIEDNGLKDGLTVTVDGEDMTGNYYTLWEVVEPNSEDVVVPVEIFLPNTADDNNYQEKTCKIKYNVEAVQANAHVTDPVPANPAVIKSFTVAELAERLSLVDEQDYATSGAPLYLSEDEDFYVVSRYGLVYDSSDDSLVSTSSDTEISFRFTNFGVAEGLVLNKVIFDMEGTFTSVGNFDLVSGTTNEYLLDTGAMTSLFINPTETKTVNGTTASIGERIKGITFEFIPFEYMYVDIYNKWGTYGYTDGDNIYGFEGDKEGKAISFANPDHCSFSVYHYEMGLMSEDYGTIQLTQGQTVNVTVPEGYRIKMFASVDSLHSNYDLEAMYDLTGLTYTGAITSINFGDDTKYTSLSLEVLDDLTLTSFRVLAVAY